MSGTLSFFQKGEKVAFLFEKGGGIVKSFTDGRIVVEDEDGFDRLFFPNELAKIHGTEYNLPDDNVAQINEDDSISKSRHTVRKDFKTGIHKPIDIWEIDLHVESILNSHAGMSHADILSFQIRELHNFFKKAKENHIRKLIIIHGVGAGVLKDEVRIFLSKKEGIEFFDADFREYGKGATAVEIRYNVD